MEEKVRVLLATERDDEVEQVQAALADYPGLGEIVVARDGVEAYMAARASRPTIAVVSAHLPRVDGILLVRTFRRSLQFREMPTVLILHGFASDRLREALEAGPSAIAVRPFPTSTLRERFEQALRTPVPPRRAAATAAGGRTLFDGSHVTAIDTRV